MNSLLIIAIFFAASTLRTLHCQQQQSFNPSVPQQQNTLNPLYNPQQSYSYFPAQNPSSSIVAFMLTGGNSGTQANQRGLPFLRELTRVNARTDQQTGAFSVSEGGVYFFTVAVQGTTTSACQILLNRDSEVILNFVAPLNQMGSQSVIVTAQRGQFIYPTTVGTCTNASFGGFLLSPNQQNTNSPFPPQNPNPYPPRPSPYPPQRPYPYPSQRPYFPQYRDGRFISYG